MAIQTANVYSFSVQQKSQQFVGSNPPNNPGYQLGNNVVILAQTPQAAQAIIQTLLGTDLANVQGPTLMAAGAYTTMTGTFTAGDQPASGHNPPNPFLPPEADHHSHGTQHKKHG